MVKVYAPASSANMSVGFDVLGAAVAPVDGSPLGDTVTVDAANSFSLTNVGRFASKLPPERAKILFISAGSVFVRKLARTCPSR